MVTNLDRMIRKLLDLLTLIEMFQEQDASFIFVGEAFDTTPATCRLPLQVLCAVAAFQRERLRERVVETMM
ncbi:recombinase family protein, partial [Bacillus anthracis]|uniref:recombinase family protein n=1 Tax=Bacillus anthracis TaxID=1392 RepID=UPI00284DE42B